MTGSICGWVPGVDLASQDEVEQALVEHGERYLARVFTPSEVALAEAMPHERAVAFLTGRFAAKEAVLKALRPPTDLATPWPTIEVLPGDEGAPRVNLEGAIAEWASGQGIGAVTVSISHQGRQALAFAIAQRHDTCTTTDERTKHEQ